LLADAGVHGVVIATPHSTHFNLARDALLAGKHVLLEKPMTLTAVDARRLREISEAEGQGLIIGHTYQYTRHASKAREIVTRGGIGEVTFVSALFSSMVAAYYQGNPEEYREVFNFPVNGPAPDTYSNPSLSGGGQGWTQMVHLMDMVFCVTGLQADRVFARMSNRDLDVDLIDSMSFALNNGGLGTAGSTGQLKPGQPQQQEIRYYGSEGYLLQDLLNGTMTIVYNDGREEEKLPDLLAEEIYPTGAPVDRLIEICRTGEYSSEALESSIAAVEFLEAAYRSAESGKDELIPRP
jgi:predicted dehydrogenase